MAIGVVASSAVMAGQGTCLVLSAPPGPVQPVGGAADGAGDEFREQVADFVDSQRDQSLCPWWAVGVFARGDGGEDGVGEHGQGGVAVPGRPRADLVLVQADFVLAGAEALLDAPAGAGDLYECAQRDRSG